MSLSEKDAPSYLPPIAWPDRLIKWCLGLLWVMNGFEELVKAVGLPLKHCSLALKHLYSFILGDLSLQRTGLVLLKICFLKKVGG